MPGNTIINEIILKPPFNSSEVQTGIFTFLLVVVLYFLICPDKFKIVLAKMIIFHENHGMKWFYLTIIMTLAFLLRSIKLDKIPLGLYWDEALFGYNAYCISETGRDETNQPWPIFLKVYGYYLSGGVFYYFIALFIKIFGPTIFALRFTSCFLGMLTLFFSYKLVKLYFGKSTALVAALLIAVSSWNIQISRHTGDPSVLPPFFVLGFYLFSLGMLKDKNKYIILSAIPIGLSFYCYAVARLFVPVFYVIFLCLNYKKLINRKQTMIIWATLIAIMLLPYTGYKAEELQNRFNGFSVFNPQIIQSEKNELEKANLSFLTKNNLTIAFSRFIKNYFMHMSFDFLLKNGDRNLRHHIGGRGQLLWFTFWMQLVGLIYIFYKRRTEFYIFPIWFFLFPVAASLTIEGLPHAGRSVYGLPVFEILAAVGFYFLFSYSVKLFRTQNIKMGILMSIVLILTVFKGYCDFDNYIKDYFNRYALRAAPWFNYEVCAIINATKDMESYDKFLMPPCDLYHATILFLQKTDPRKWQKREIELKYVVDNPPRTYECNKKIARIAKPRTHVDEKTVGYVRHDITKEIMFEIKEVKCQNVS